MPVAYYIIPMTEPPYSRQNPQRPQYVDEIKCNWVGHPVDALGVYICKVNTTEAKHTDLAGRTGVRQLPRSASWDTVISTLPAAARNAISNWCNGKGIPYAASETIGQLLMRIINSGLFSLGSTALATQYQNLTQTQKDKVTALCAKWSLPQPAATETVRQITDRLGPTFWPGSDETRVHVEEF
jgi:hypothetical protein